jgi:hypothetical protein
VAASSVLVPITKRAAHVRFVPTAPAWTRWVNRRSVIKTPSRCVEAGLRDTRLDLTEIAVPRTLVTSLTATVTSLLLALKPCRHKPTGFSAVAGSGVRSRVA